MPKQNKTKLLSETILRALDKPLEDIYRAFEASEAENIHCKVAKAVQSLLNKQRVRDREEIVEEIEEFVNRPTILDGVDIASTEAIFRFLFTLKSYKLKEVK